MLFEAYKNFCNNFSSKCITQLEEKVNTFRIYTSFTNIYLFKHISCFNF